jgi:hypothetical protein
MAMTTERTHVRAGLILAAVLGAVSPATAQQILLDEPVRAGEIVLFRDLNDAKAYYYAPTRPRLAKDANGRPQFSFFRWVENTRSGAKDADVREGDGGGIIHALVTFGVPKELLREAERDLQRQRPGARIAGPIVPKSGTFALVSTVTDPKDGKSKLATQVVGVGNAPLLDGDKAAVSILLNKSGAEILWAQFQTPTPDISFSFEIDVSGFLAPKRAVIEANLDEVLKHDAFNVGIAGNWFAGEIKGVFDDLRRRNVIKITQVGEDEAMNTLVTYAYNKLVDMLFDKTSAGVGGITADPAAAAGGEGMLTRATAQLEAARKASEGVRTQNEGIDKENAKRKALRDEAANAEKKERGLRSELAEAEAAAAAARSAADAAQAESQKLDAAAKAAEAKDPTAAAPVREKATAAAARATEAAGKITAADARVAELKTKVETARTEAQSARKAATEAGPDQQPRDVPSEPGFAIVGSYTLKRSRATGMFRLDLNKYLPETRHFRFDENIGDLRALVNDTGHFRQVNLDDPLYRQREIVAAVDGVNAEDFGQFVNFVSLRMRKKHDGGELTNDEIRIDRKNFNQEGNTFKLLYGWKGDKSRAKWMDYEYQAVWSFFGGYQVEQPWTAASASAINLAPPVQRRVVELHADKTLLADQGVRSITVKVFYKPAPDAPEQVRQVTLNAAAEAVAGRLEFISPRDVLDYDYEITWRLTGNRTATSGRQTTSSTILHVDEVSKPTTPQPVS